MAKDFYVTMKLSVERQIMFYEPGNLCEICSKILDVREVCKVCGNQVCSECFVSKRQICLTCNEALCYICNEFLASRACNICGKLVCEDHGMKRGEATICQHCLKERP